jgi:chemotaxis protein CheD
MYKYFDNRLKKPAVNLAPGEYYFSAEDLIINTVLGSCVSVVLYDPVLKAGGMNHFMLAESRGKIVENDYFKIERYGLYAMEALINEVLKHGGKKSRLMAKIFGGSRVLHSNNKMDIGVDNIEFAERYLDAENIPIISRDTGGIRARRIYLYPQSFRILLKRVQRSTEFERAMEKYKAEVTKKAGQGSETVIF